MHALTLQDRERLAYIAGDTATAALFAQQLDDEEALAEAQNEADEAAKEAAEVEDSNNSRGWALLHLAEALEDAQGTFTADELQPLAEALRQFAKHSTGRYAEREFTRDIAFLKV